MAPVCRLVHLGKMRESRLDEIYIFWDGKFYMIIIFDLETIRDSLQTEQ